MVSKVAQSWLLESVSDRYLLRLVPRYWPKFVVVESRLAPDVHLFETTERTMQRELQGLSGGFLLRLNGRAERYG